MIASSEVVKVKDCGTPEQTTRAIFDELKRDLGEWMTAHHDLVWRPGIEMTTEGKEFAARALMPGMEAKDLEVMVAPEMLLIRGEARDGRKVLRSIKFPRAVNPARVHAELEDGMLCVRAEIAGASRILPFMPRAA
jgi:HSP20 family molecular chaperone IbpA